MPIRPVQIIVPTWNNAQYLVPMIESVYASKILYPMEFIVVNNGHPQSVDMLKSLKEVKIVQCTENLGWEGGLKEGLKHSDSEFVMFANDDIFIPYSSTRWLRNMMWYFGDPKVGAVGPISNCVMGPQQIFVPGINGPSFYGNYLIGFCMLLRREALDKAGGVDDTLPGGDDLDLSIRLKKAGYKLMVSRESFVYHHGFKTGERLHGGPQNGGWNSQEMTERTNHALIRKHGLRAWFDMLYSNYEVPEFNIASDAEGKVISDLIASGSVLELGCGGKKTVPQSVGVDFYAKGEMVPTINQLSVADVQGSVEKLDPSLGKFDYIISRHILEHMMDPIAVLRHWCSFLRPEGKIFIAVPDDAVCDSVSLNPEHKHAFTKESLKTLMSMVGLDHVLAVDAGNGHSIIGMGINPVKAWVTDVSVKEVVCA